MSLHHHQHHAGTVHPAPIHHAPARPALVHQNQLGTRTGSPTTGSSTAFQRLIDKARQLSGNNAQAVLLVQRALPTVQRIEADFARPVTVAAAVPGPSEFLDFLDRACQHTSSRDQARDRLDVMSLRQFDQMLRAFGIQFAEAPFSRQTSAVFSRH